MVDAVTRQPLRLTTGPDGADWSYLELPDSQVAAVREVLDRHGVRYWMDELVVSVDDGPEFAMIHFSRNEDPKAVQAILDAVD